MISYCIPIVAIGPLMVLILGLPQPGEPSKTAIFFAGLSVFFTTVVGALLGLKSADKASLDVVSVYGGSRYFSDEVTSTLVTDYLEQRQAGPEKSPLERLSGREREILQLVVEGKSSAELGQVLSLSPKTVETYRNDGQHWVLLATFADKDEMRAEPFDSIPLQLASLWDW